MHYNTHLKEHIATSDWEYIEFTDLSKKLYNKEELKFLENYLIEDQEPRWNKQLNIVKNLTEKRKNELIDILNSCRWEFYKENEHKKKLI